jgi:predicted peptidase
MITRREAVRLLGAAAAGAWLAAADIGPGLSLAPMAFAKNTSAPELAPGAPTSAERTALIDSFTQRSEGLQDKYEARTYRGDFTMPYRLFRPVSKDKLPLVVYLHGSGGQGDDNQKQLGLGNTFSTRVWLLPENQKQFPCYVVVPQTDRGWARYDMSVGPQGPPKILPGMGDGNRLVLEIIAALQREFPIDERRIYVTGQSMGGLGVWNIMSNRPGFFAAAVPCCGSRGVDDGAASPSTPLWAFHGAADQVVPVSISRDRIAARRKAGAHPLYTEYADVDHNVWEWAYTEPELVKWVFAQKRS